MKLGLIAAVVTCLSVGCGGAPYSAGQDVKGDPAPQGDDAGTVVAPQADAGASVGGDAGQAGDDAGKPATGQQDAGAVADGAPPTCPLQAPAGMCGVVDGCNYGSACAVPTDLCGGGTETLNAPANECGHACLATAPGSYCGGSVKYTHFVQDQGCAYIYTIVNGAPQVIPSTANCVWGTDTAGAFGLCCP